MLVPRRTRRAHGTAGRASSVEGSTAPTPILDWESLAIANLGESIRDHNDLPERAWLCQAHKAIRPLVRPVYALDDVQPTSKTIARRRGSCSQRLAILEALARRHGIRTRVEGLAVDGRFWYARFPRTPWLVPDQVILAWPEFHIDGQWIPAGEIYDADATTTGIFTNVGAETLFDAIGQTGVAWHGDCSDGVCDLSGHVLARLGYFNHRDEVFAAHGQTLCRTARTIGEPVMSHRSAGART